MHRARLVPRARALDQEEGARGTWVVVVTEIPWLVQKSRLVEKIAELLNEKKLPLVGDVRDESAEDVRLVIEPKSRAVDPELLMESLFRLTELESRIPLNMNVLVKGRIPKVLGLAECLREWLDHLRDVLLRRSNYRKEQIEHRLEVLGGYLIAYLNIDKVIKIIRTEDEPKPADQGVQADGGPGRRHPQHALRNLAQARGNGDPHRGQESSRNELKGIKGCSLRGRAMEEGRRAGPQSARHLRAEDAARQAPHPIRRCARARSRRDRGSLCRARAGHGRGVRQGLGAHAEGPCRRSLGAHLQDRRQARPGVLRRDHVEAAAVRHQRQILFARRRKLPGGRGHGEPIRVADDFVLIDRVADDDVIVVVIAVLRGDGAADHEAAEDAGGDAEARSRAMRFSGRGRADRGSGDDGSGDESCDDLFHGSDPFVSTGGAFRSPVVDEGTLAAIGCMGSEQRV
jgi:hypothetical protein